MYIAYLDLHIESIYDFCCAVPLLDPEISRFSIKVDPQNKAVFQSVLDVDLMITCLVLSS